MKASLFLLLIVLTTTTFAQVDHWETAVYADDTWRYHIGDSEPPANWRATSFNDNNWLEGAGSIGYGDGDDATVIPPTESLYMRQKFTVTDKTKIGRAILHADFDDGFVAYLNGTEIARANMAEAFPPHNSWATALREAQMYQGNLPLAFSVDPSLLEQLLLDGENVLTLQTHNFEGLASSDLTTLYWLSFGIKDNSMDYGPLPSWFVPIDFDSPLPIVKINTGGIYIPDEPSIQGEMGIIWNGDGQLNNSAEAPNEFMGNISIERRGQSSLGLYPKNGYAIETKDANWEDLDVAFLNFPEEEDWVLHGPYGDKTLLRNVLAMHLAKGMGQYASRTRLVELLINEEYEGVYVLLERIKRDVNRVDIAKLKEEDISGDERTGGYVFKIDKGIPDWYSRYDIVNNPGEKLRFQYVSPKSAAIQPEQANYIQAYVDSFEMAMRFPDVPFGGKRYDEYIDLPSFADHFLLQELTRNIDAYRNSTYMYKDKDSNGGLIKAGPAWDYNLAFGNVDFCEGDATEGWMYDRHCDLGNPFWWGKMFADEAFANTAKCRWLELREGPFHLDTIFAFVDDKVALLNPVVERNFQRWPILDEYVWPNPVVTGSYQGEINFMKNHIRGRIAWMDANMLGTCTVNSKEELVEGKKIKISPNPVVDVLQLTIDLPESADLEVAVFDVLGRPILERKIRKTGSGEAVFKITLHDMERSTGSYFLQVKQNGLLLAVKRFVLVD